MKNLVVKTVGGCMRPLISDGNIVFIRKKNNYRIGDIVLYEINSEKFLHRITKVLPNKRYVVCDDTATTLPVEIGFENIIGFYPNIFNGLFGYFYHIVIRTIFLIKKIANL